MEKTVKFSSKLKKYTDYIPVIEENYSLLNLNVISVVEDNRNVLVKRNVPIEYFIPFRKIPIENIKFDRSLLSFPNPIYEGTVQTILEHFNEYAWFPILINKDYFLLDGQHRLEVAHRLNLRFIDAIIDNQEAVKEIAEQIVKTNGKRICALKDKRTVWL